MTKFIKIAACLILIFSTCAFAEDAPSDASIKELLAVTHAEGLLDSALNRIDTTMQAAMDKALAGKTLNAEQKKIVDEFKAQYVAMFKEAMNWKTMEGDYVAIYKSSFNQKEVDAMIAFYKSEAGQAVLAKMPLVMQNTMKIVQQKIVAILPHIQQMQQDAIGKIKSAETPAAG